MDHKTFLDKLATESGLDKALCSSLIDGLIDIFGSNLVEDEMISIPSFGSFELRKRKERIISHPSSPQKRLLIPPKLVINFKPSLILKNKINNIERDEQ